MQKKKIKMRIMSFLLCILMVFTSIPLDAAAMSYSNSEGELNFLSMIDEELERFESSGETELYKDYAVEDHQNDLEDYQKADKLSLEMLADDSNSNDLTISIEKYDGEGNGSWLIKPKKIAKRQYYNDDVISAIREAYGANDFVQFESTDRTDGVSADYYYITSVYDVDQEDNYLANGEMGSDSKWEIYINNQEWSHTRYVPEYYLKAGDVVRLVYTTNNTQNPVATNRDELIKIIGEYAPEIWYESSVGYQELQAALEKLVDLDATSGEIETAKNNLINAFSATAVEISQGDEYLLGLDKTATLKATVTPKNTKDKVVWSTDNANIATVDADTGVVKGISEGKATITATAGNVSDSIKVTVGKIPATNVVIKNEDKITIEKRFDVQLETEVTPADTTDVVRWSSADANIATVDANGLVHGVSVGSTTITATAGNVTDTCQIEVVDTTSPYVYFKYADGSVQEMVNNTFTLTALDVGKFVVGNYDEKVTWKCSDTGSDGSGGYEYRYWIDSDGDYNPFEVKKMQATVSGTGLSKSFYIDTVSSGISSIKAYIGDKEVSIDNPYEVTGIASGIPVTVKGFNENSEWVNVPEQAFKSTSTDSTGNIRVYAGLLDINTEGEAEITITMIDNADAKTSFKAKCNSVKVEKIKVHAPENFVIDKWDSQGSGYVGITHGYESSNSEYYITYTPSNATNQEVIWEDLTPEIAEFHELHSAGIVPKKAGLAKFKVISQSNPNEYDEVSINFTYKTPLTNATVSQSSYKMEAGTSEDLVITMVPENATEQRFSWTYDKEGIVKVNESVSADTTTRYISRKIIALSNGKVTVTGTPLDHTGNCQPIEFEVTVGGGSGNVETIDYLGMAKADINHGLSYLSNQINHNYGSEWTLFTYLRAGGTIENANNYFASVETELNNNAQYLNATDYARLVITLPLLGQNPTNFAGFNLVEKLYNNLSLGSQTSNQISWTLLALDSHKYEIPDNAVWTREKLIEKILTFQAVDGGFGLSGNSSGSVDMTGMILQALAPYNTEEYPKVQSAFSQAVNYLKSKINENVGYIAEGGENGCTAAQVLTALSIAKIDPTNSANGFVFGNKNLITNLHSFKQSSGFAYLLGQGTNLQGTQQITYALEAYRRYAENENSLYDLMDIVLPGEEVPEETAALPITVTVDGEPVEITSLGERTYLSSVFKDPYTKPIYTVKVPANTDFVIGQTETGDGASGANRVFAMADGMSMDGAYPYEMTAAKLNGNYIISAEELVERVGDDTGLDTNNKVAFIEVKDSSYERLYVLLVELLSSGEDTPEEVIPIKVETFEGTLLTITENGMQSVNGAEVPVLEVGIPKDLKYVKAILNEGYKVYNCYVNYEEYAPYLSTDPYDGDFYNLVNSNGTVEYVIKFVNTTKETFTITLPTGEGYVATAAEGSTSPVEKGADYSFTVEISDGYEAGENFVVKANDVVLEPNNSGNLLTKAFNYVLNLFGADESIAKEFTYTIENIQEHQIVTVEGVEKEVTTAALPITVTVDGESVEVTSLGERPYLSSSFKDKYTRPIYTVKVPANTDFVIGQTETGDGASGANRVFAMADGMSLDGAYPYTMTAANLNNYYVLSTDEFVTRVGNDTGLDTNNKVAFIEVKDSNYERLYVLLVELISSGDDTQEDTMPIKAETLDGKKLTVTEKGKQSVNGKDVPVLEIGVYEGTTSVKVTPSGSYRVYDCDGFLEANASNLSTAPTYEDFYTLTKDHGQTIDYVIKFVIVEEKILPVKAETLDGTPLNVTENGKQVVGNVSVPVLEIEITEGTECVKVIPSGNYRVYDAGGFLEANASNLPTVPGYGEFYTLTKDGGKNIDYVIKFVIAEPVTEKFTVTLPTGEGYIATAEEGSTSPVEKGSDFSFTVKVLSGFKPGENFAVKANGTVLEPNSNDTLLTRAFIYVLSLFNENEIKGKEYHYTIKDIQENQNVTVEDVERLTTTDKLAIISGDKVYDVSKLGNMNYKQADFGTVSDVPVYKATLPADVDFEISWDANKDGGKTSSRYAFAIDAGGDMREKYYPLEMEAKNIEAYVLTPEQIKNYFGEEIELNLEHEIAFIEIYDGEHIEADLRLLYGLFIEFAPEIVETFNVTLPTGDGYTVVPESTSLINKGESYSFEVKIDAAYDGSNMIVKANGNVLEKVNGKYTIENVLSDQIITIEGVVPKVVGSITVKFAMFGDHVHAEDEKDIHTLYDGNLELWIDAKEYNVSSKAKVIDVIDLAFSENNLTYRNTGNYISHVTRNGVTLGAFTNGSLSGWMYTLNGAYSNLGVEEQGLKDGDIIVFYYTDDYTRENHSITLEKIDDVMGLINDLPENITLDDEAKVISAEEGYLALNEYQKILIRNYEKLAAAGKELAELKKSAEDEDKASKVEDFIDKIGKVTLSSKEKIDQAFAEYEKLTDIQKKLVDNYDELIAAKNKLILLENAKHEEVYRTTGDYLEQLAKESKNAVFGSEWVMFGLSRSGRKIPAAYIKDVASYVARTIDGSGRLDKTRSTENSRLIYALTAAGYNAMDVAGYNLLSGLSDMKFVTKQGINGTIFALIALQCHEDYEIPKVATGGTQTSVDALIDEILNKELTTGGWNLGGKEKPLDADVTAMAIQALAPYYNDASVKKAIDKALDELSKIQNEEGAFGSVDGASSESCAQVIVALTSLRINPETDTRFVKNGNSVVDALCSFYVENGGFKHVASGELNGMASEQGYYAMAAYMRLLNNQTSLYDMNDVVLNGMIVSPNEPDTPDTPNTETSDADKKAAKQVEDIIDAIGRVTIYSENRIKEARKAYNNLTFAQKKLVSNYDVLLAAEEKYEDAKVAYVEDLIDSIGTVSLNSKTAINRARIAYNLLSAASKAEVYNYDKLVAAETLYAKLLSEDKNTVNKAETNKSNKTNKTNATTVKNSPIEKTKIAEYVDDLLESINRDSLNGEIFDAIMAYEELTDVEKISLDKESLVADLKQMLSEKIHVDQKTGILVSGAEWDVRLVVEDVSDMGRIQSMQDKMENAVLLGLWDISLVKMYGNEKYQPEETVLVKIPLKLLGDYTSYEGLVIAHYTDEGQTEYLNCTIMGEYLVFNAIDFSDYAVIGYNDGSAFHDALNGTDDYNGTAMEWIPWTIAGGCSMALLAVLFLMLKKRNEKINKENR